MSNKETARAFGRVNLIGEHTDYNGGWVLPTTIPQFTEVTIEKNVGSIVWLQSSSDPIDHGPREFSFELGQEVPTHTWVDYLQGGTKLLNEFLKSRNEEITGFTAIITSNIPEGSGLSSSAALEMSFLKALKKSFNFHMSDVELALLGQRIENEFVGARVGIMDQMATSLAQEGEALFLDTLNLTYERVPLPMNEMDLMVINSGISHRLSSKDGGYNERRSQCEEAARLLGVKLLRDASTNDPTFNKLPHVLMKRARHVMTENERVKEAVKAIKAKDLEYLGELFIASHISMRDDYEVSIPEIDYLVELCLKEEGVFGARLTGGGFGGSIVAILKKGLKERIAHKLIPLYEKETGEKGTLLV